MSNKQIKLSDLERTEFMMYFAGIVAMARNHPGAGSAKYQQCAPSLKYCAEEAINMIKVRREMIG